MIQGKYALTSIYEFSRYYWVHFVKHKSEVVDLFKVFRALVENKFGRKLKILRSKNGGEYVKFDFIQYYTDATFNPLRTTANGVAERKNRSLKEMATYMMEAKTFPPKFWARLQTMHPKYRIGFLISNLMV